SALRAPARPHHGDVDAFLNKMYRTKADFVFTVTRDFVRACQTPPPVLPGHVPAHPYAVAMESVRLAPHAEATVYPWKEPKELRAKTVQQVHDFLRVHKPATATR